MLGECHGHRDTTKLPVLIDADNAEASICEELLVEVMRYGTTRVRHVADQKVDPNLNGLR